MVTACIVSLSVLGSDEVIEWAIDKLGVGVDADCSGSEIINLTGMINQTTD